MGSWKQKRSRKAISLDDLKLKATDAVKAVEEIILTSDDENRKINAINALSGLISRYAKLVETSDLEKRVQELEKRQNEMRKVS